MAKKIRKSRQPRSLYIELFLIGGALIMTVLTMAAIVLDWPIYVVGLVFLAWLCFFALSFLGPRARERHEGK